ncbi:TIGR02444 family protein [Photobacterium profundum]|uniref:TIGR02444 family protein n=1 Tax=Photobacterium profundum (strain SS9) TaxID=298386 RepID=Q6LVD6_PHOPR|nr:TIGR02444 family protein [Photobacterium profundum]CAG18739.1 hypothetical protein PBPRA0300 [Photobacterium profundum SS9]
MQTADSVTLNSQDFWQFSLSHYTQAGVQPACLTLQDSYQGNVNLALLLHWLDTQKVQLSDAELHTLEVSIASSDCRFQQYRAMRKQLKTQLDLSGYKQLLAFELKLEQDQQYVLVTQFNQFNVSPPKVISPSLLTNNLARYCLQQKATVLLSKLQAA